MSYSLRHLALGAVMAVSATSLIAIDLAEAGGTKRRTSRDGIMRLGGPANGNGNGAAFVDRTGGPTFTSPANVRAFALSSGSDRNGPGL